MWSSATRKPDRAGYLFYPAANATQDRIWHDTAETWGEGQAEAYIRGLHAHLEKLCRTPAIWRALPSDLIPLSGIVGRIYVSRYRRHYLFFREFDSGNIGVMSILHERMDVPARLAEELVKLPGGLGGEDAT